MSPSSKTTIVIVVRCIIIVLGALFTKLDTETAIFIILLWIMMDLREIVDKIK